MAVDSPSKNQYSTTSRAKLQDWFRPRAGKPMSLIELSNGVTYCQLLAQLFPGVLDKKKVKQPAGYELDRVHNWKLFQQALRKLKVEKEINILERIKPHSSGNLDFCRWFISFYEANKGRPLPAPLADDSVLVSPRRDEMILHEVPMGDRAIWVTGRTGERRRAMQEMRTAEEATERSLSPTGITPTSHEETMRNVTMVDGQEEMGGWMDREPEDSHARDNGFLVISPGGNTVDASTIVVFEEDEPSQEPAKGQMTPSRKYITPHFSTPNPKDSMEFVVDKAPE